MCFPSLLHQTHKLLPTCCVPQHSFLTEYTEWCGELSFCCRNKYFRIIAVIIRFTYPALQYFARYKFFCSSLGSPQKRNTSGCKNTFHWIKAGSAWIFDWDWDYIQCQTCKPCQVDWMLCSRNKSDFGVWISWEQLSWYCSVRYIEKLV